jgi:predicted extracellular nuclease
VFDLSNRFRGGDTVTGVTGMMDHTFGLYRVQPTAYGTYTAVNPRPASPENVGGRLQVAAFNTLNYFVSLDLGPDICGPLQNQECRGADDQNELDRQRSKLLAALVGIDADVVGLIEIENTTGVEAIADVVAGLNGILGAGTYDYIVTGTIGGDAIKQGIIYRPGVVTPVGDHAILVSSVDPRFIDTANRPVLAQTFEENATGAVFTVSVNHLKSKGSACAGDPDIGDGQGNCNQTRKAAAAALIDWLASDPTDSGDADHLILGDLNAYALEDPIDVIRAGHDATPGTPDDYTDLINAYQGDRAYGYVFDGQSGYLDHALAPPSMAGQVTGATEWHANADEPDLLDYDTSFKLPPQEALFEPNAFRSSDHDPVIVGLDLEVFDFSGILPPLSSDGPNVRMAGRGLQVQFSLGGDFGTELFAAGYPAWQSCAGGPLSAATLQRRPRLGNDGVYDVRVEVPASFAGTCQVLHVVLVDGSRASVVIEFI